jgi:predicted Ser/Thr protein kinase
VAAFLRAVDDRDEPNDVLVPRADADAAGAFVAEGTPSSPSNFVIANRYEIIARIGRGATGSVYRALDRTLDRHVAIKLLHPGEFGVAEREAQVLAKVTHRNVVTIHDSGHDPEYDGGHRFLVLELLEGRDFHHWLRERPTPDEIIESFVEAGRGLSAAHKAGLVHRDFKPSNVILTYEGRVVVIDFGLARNLDSHGGEFESRRFTEGTLAYMAPERLAGHDNDERSDQFSFCVALWEALAGTNPFTGEDPLARYRSIRRGPKRRGVDLGVAKHIAAALERGVAYDRVQRFSTMDELLRELERPTPAARDRRGRPVLMAAAVAAAFVFGWGGFAPESPMIDEAYSSLDPTAEAAMAILDSARKRAADGDFNTAVNDMLHAAELIQTVGVHEGRGTAEFCAFAKSIPNLGDLMFEQGATNQALVCYAVVTRYAEKAFCDELDVDDLKFRSESIRSTMWAKGDR